MVLLSTNGQDPGSARRAVAGSRRPLDDKRAIDQRGLEDEVAALRKDLQSRYSFQNVISKSRNMHAIFDLIGSVAQTATTLLIEGETGTGKEQVARAVHEASRARRGPMIAVACAAIPEHLLESELFGHEKGAFTNAVSQRKGRFELAEGGTLLLDEIGDMAPLLQAKLLRVLQERRFERVGSTESIAVDVRVVAATNRRLCKMVRQGTFREDLYYRLNVVKIELPPLRDRSEDIPLLATHFAQKFARPGMLARLIAPEAMDSLQAYSWPGNVRELESAIERGSITTKDEFIRTANLPADILNGPSRKSALAIDLSRTLGEHLDEITARIEERYLRKAMWKTRGNISRTAIISGMSRRSITQKIAFYKIDKLDFKAD